MKRTNVSKDWHWIGSREGIDYDKEIRKLTFLAIILAADLMLIIYLILK